MIYVHQRMWIFLAKYDAPNGFVADISHHPSVLLQHNMPHYYTLPEEMGDGDLTRFHRTASIRIMHEWHTYARYCSLGEVSY